MRLVFLLYAEDRDLLPSSTDPDLNTLWEGSYSIKTLYQKLQTDEALNPDTMDERRGAWGQLLAVFRIIFDGHDHWVAKRGGKLFDPDAFPFLEGREKGTDRRDAKVLPVSDGCILRILYDLMTVEARGFSGEKIRERLSYRSLDVESIGSVYETVMGFTALRATEQMVALRDEKKLPTFIGLETLLSEKSASRQKWLKDHSIKLSAKQNKAVKEAGSIEELLEGFGSAIDERASPKGYAIGRGTPYLQPTEERRRSGSHYTPRSLTEPIVRHALEPAFERIGTNASPEAVLALKVCDPACGSGAFLVEACRQLGARLEQAWDIHEAEKPAIPPDEDEATHARRLVAQRCLYGVDRNPMAVDLARLSLWLATLAREHEFSFLDHTLKSGDSLVGLTQHEIAAVHWDASKPGLPLFRGMIKDAVDNALQGREAIRNAGDDVLTEAQAARYSRVQDASKPARIVGDAIVSAFFSADKARARELERQKVESWITGHLQPRWEDLEARAKAFRTEKGWTPFHWEIEFPEVFSRENPGFDAFVGNPPFAGKNTISAASGPGYLPWIQQLHENAHGNADLVAHFFRRAFNLLRDGGAFGLIATNTIGQGDTRATGLAAILQNDGNIFRAIKRYQWPNEGAAVIVSIVHVGKSISDQSPLLDGLKVPRISAYLVAGDFDESPDSLSESSGKAFIGYYLLGTGFIFDDEGAEKGQTEPISEMERLIAKDPKNAERIWPYIGGEEINNSPNHSHHRFVINFDDFPLKRDPTSAHPWGHLNEKAQRIKLREGIVSADYPGPVAADWPDLLEVLEQRVKPARLKQKDKFGKKYWWRFLRTRPELNRAKTGFENVIVAPRVSPHVVFTYLPSNVVANEKVVVIPSDDYAIFSILHCRVFEIWGRLFSSTLKDDFNLAPSDCVTNFPFPEEYETHPSLKTAGEVYHDHRAALMIAADEGMTKTYNRFHKENERGEAIQQLRKLHDEMDLAVLRAYGWDDLAEEVHPQFLTEETEDDHTYQNRYFWPAEQRDKVLSRLLALNAERHAEEVRLGIATKAPARDNDANDENGDDDKGAGLFD
ncbi:Eco57I restriction-modification methylase domain-containing protein [Roseibium polysiphoniae]|nr:DNA methyltransferase [Roseibium polysiphoniae]